VSFVSSISAGPNRITTIRQPVDDAPLDPTSSNAADKTTELIITLLQPHTGVSSENLDFLARAITSLIVGHFNADDLRDLLDSYLDTLVISPQARQHIIPALMGFTEVIEVRSRV
jgi:hypothetical protein